MAVLGTIRLCDVDDAPEGVEDTRALNDALFVGRLLGVDVGPAVSVLDNIDRGRTLSCGERRTLRRTYAEVRHRLAAAIDDDGRAIPGQSDALLTSSVVAADLGVLYLKGGGRVNLIELVRALEAIGHLLDVAEERALAVEVLYR